MDVPSLGGLYSIFELACKTYGKHDFISACLDEPAPDIKVRANPATLEYPIHLAVRSMDKRNLEALLSGGPENSSQLVKQQCKNRTALFFLFERLNSSNEKCGFECMKVLLENGADINTANGNHVTAVERLLEGNESWRRRFVEYCLNTGKVLLNPPLTSKIQRAFPGITLPHVDGTRYQILMLKMESKTDEEFIASFEQEASKGDITSAEVESLLWLAIQLGRLNVVQKLVDYGTNNRQSAADGQTDHRLEMLSNSLSVCCKYGNVPILQWLLKEIPEEQSDWINKNPLLCSLTIQINGNVDKVHCSFFKCMEELLKDPRVRVNETDSQRFTALHYAVKYGLEHVQELLLEKGAYLGGEDLFGRALICDINPFLLRRHLNRCVTDNGTSPDDQDYNIKLNFQNFQSPTRDDEMLPIVRSPTRDDEMLPIVRLAQLPDGRQLLKHPVIASIVLIKWLRISVFFYLNLLICCMFFFSFTAFMVFFYSDKPSNVNKWYSLGPAIVGLAYITLREVAQFALNARQYFKSLENYIELMLVVSSVTALTLHFTTGNENIRKSAEIFAIMLSAVEFTVLLATIPRLSFCTHMVMLKTVARNFIQCLALYSAILIGFGISFYTLFRGSSGNASGGEPKNATSPSVAPNNASTTEELNKFKEFNMISLALLKTTVMMTGELEAGDLRLDQSWGYYALFSIFLFFVPIVLYNLLNGLAVYDAMAIQTESELIAIRQKVFVINQCEASLKGFNGLCNIWMRFFGEQPYEMMKNFEYIVIQPNHGNKIQVPTKASNATNQLSNEVTVSNGTKPANDASDAEEGKIELLQHSFEVPPELPLSDLSGTIDPVIVTAARGILCSKEMDSANPDLQLQQIIHHLSEEMTKMNNLLVARHQYDLAFYQSGNRQSTTTPNNLIL
ncbi:AGAP013463-PA-like protein [Anopheles sinensis]|uniref:AGAP013463-PA-like protein n=1 Tax=Anopheles sinensis TaxID=74873 RepID=A0A084W947_ANOSI|nr:AGAP013463-PA-like protein [Anopheles sinensis]